MLTTLEPRVVVALMVVVTVVVLVVVVVVVVVMVTVVVHAGSVRQDDAYDSAFHSVLALQRFLP